MENADFIKMIRALVSEGETKLALDKLLEQSEALPTFIVKDITLIKSRFRQLNDNFNIRGFLKREEYESSSIQISYSILEIMEKIEKLTKSEKIEYDRTKGKLLHHIPKVMPVGKETRCVVRIAYDEKTLIEGFNLTGDSLIENVRIAKVMSVELIDFADTIAFNIRPITSDEQFVVSDDYSQWIFMVKPILQGIHSLTLKVAVIEQIDGKDRRKEIVLEKEISIVGDSIDSIKKVGSPIFEDSHIRLHYATPLRRFMPQKRLIFSMIGILFAFVATATLGVFLVNKYYFESKKIKQIQKDSLKIYQNEIVDSIKNMQNTQQNYQTSREVSTNETENRFIAQNRNENKFKKTKDSLIKNIDSLNKKDIIVNSKSVEYKNIENTNESNKISNLKDDTLSNSQTKAVIEVIRLYKVKIYFNENAKDSEVYIDGERAEIRNWKGSKIVSFTSGKILHEILLKKGTKTCLMKNVKIDREYMEIEPSCLFFRE